MVNQLRTMALERRRAQEVLALPLVPPPVPVRYRVQFTGMELVPRTASVPATRGTAGAVVPIASGPRSVPRMKSRFGEGWGGIYVRREEYREGMIPDWARNPRLRIVTLAYGMPRLVNVATLRAIVAPDSAERMFRKLGNGWQILPDSALVDLDDPTKEYRLGETYTYTDPDPQPTIYS